MMNLISTAERQAPNLRMFRRGSGVLVQFFLASRPVEHIHSLH